MAELRPNMASEGQGHSRAIDQSEPIRYFHGTHKGAQARTHDRLFLKI